MLNKAYAILYAGNHTYRQLKQYCNIPRPNVQKEMMGWLKTELGS
jgi:hypothetical protein